MTSCLRETCGGVGYILVCTGIQETGGIILHLFDYLITCWVQSCNNRIIFKNVSIYF